MLPDQETPRSERPAPASVTTPTNPTNPGRKEERPLAPWRRSGLALLRILLLVASLVGGVAAAIEVWNRISSPRQVCVTVLGNPFDVANAVVVVTPAAYDQPPAPYRPDAIGSFFLNASCRGGTYIVYIPSDVGTMIEVAGGVVPARGRLTIRLPATAITPPTPAEPADG